MSNNVFKDPDQDPIFQKPLFLAVPYVPSMFTLSDLVLITF